MKLLLASMLLLSSFAAFSQDCSEAETTYDIKICLSKELDKHDADLNQQYKLCMKKLDKVAQNKLRAAQKAWISFRDADCEFQADENRGGTLEGVSNLSCLSSKTKTRADEIRDCVEFR